MVPADLGRVEAPHAGQQTLSQPEGPHAAHAVHEHRALGHGVQRQGFAKEARKPDAVEVGSMVSRAPSKTSVLFRGTQTHIYFF